MSDDQPAVQKGPRLARMLSCRGCVHHRIVVCESFDDHECAASGNRFIGHTDPGGLGGEVRTPDWCPMLDSPERS
jgi:hypothetical protein